jgi:hypothetical protein
MIQTLSVTLQMVNNQPPYWQNVLQDKTRRAMALPRLCLVHHTRGFDRNRVCMSFVKKSAIYSSPLGMAPLIVWSLAADTEAAVFLC